MHRSGGFFFFSVWGCELNGTEEDGGGGGGRGTKVFGLRRKSSELCITLWADLHSVVLHSESPQLKWQMITVRETHYSVLSAQQEWVWGGGWVGSGVWDIAAPIIPAVAFALTVERSQRLEQDPYTPPTFPLLRLTRRLHACPGDEVEGPPSPPAAAGGEG